MQISHNKIKICTWNTRGLSASIPYLRTLCRTNEVVCINEHWLHQNRLSRLGDISPDFNYFGRSSIYSASDRYGYYKGQGGVAILWSNNLHSVTPLPQIQHDRICAIRLQCTNDAVFNIFSVYLPARGCADDLGTTLDELGAIIENTELGSYNIVCGDFNADLGNLGGIRSNKIADKRGELLSAFISRYNLTPANLSQNATGLVNTHHGPTGESCLDYIMLPSHLLENVSMCHTN